MGMQQYLKEIGRGKDGARALTRTQAAELMGWLLDGQAHPLQVGAFCVAMRIKGETAQEMAGFMDALQARMPQLPPSSTPVVVLPSYNGARRLPVLTPLLALLLVREGLPVLLHGCTTEETRITATEVLGQLGHPAATALRMPQAGELVHLHTRQLHAGLADLLDARATIGLRNPAHSLVKHFNPLAASGTPALVGLLHPPRIQPEHAGHACRSTKSCPAAARHGRRACGRSPPPACHARHPARQSGQQHGAPDWQRSRRRSAARSDAAANAALIQEMLNGQRPVPASIATQVQAIVSLHRQLSAQGAQA